MSLPDKLDRKKINLDGDFDFENNEAQSDLVRLALFFPYFPADVQDSFNFSEKWWKW